MRDQTLSLPCWQLDRRLAPFGLYAVFGGIVRQRRGAAKKYNR